MSLVAFTHAVRRSLRSAATLAAVAGLFFWVVLFGSSSFLQPGDVQNLPPVLREPPRALEAFVGGNADFTSPVGWLSTAMMHVIVLALTTMGALLVVSRSGATELEQGTLDLVLSRPVGRRRYIVARAAAGLVLLTVVEFGSFLGVMVARLTIDGIDRIPVGDVALTFLGHWLLFASIGMVGLWIFSRSALRSRALGASIAFTVGTFFVNFMALLIDELHWARFLSPFHYFRAADILQDVGYVNDWLVLLALAVVGAVAGVVTFARRDLTR